MTASPQSEKGEKWPERIFVIESRPVGCEWRPYSPNAIYADERGQTDVDLLIARSLSTDFRLTPYIRADLAAPTASDENLRILCSQAYQIVGVLADAAGVFDQPQVQAALTALSLSNDEPVPVPNLLPFTIPAPSKQGGEAVTEEVTEAMIEIGLFTADDVGSFPSGDTVKSIYLAMRAAAKGAE